MITPATPAHEVASSDKPVVTLVKQRAEFTTVLSFTEHIQTAHKLT